MTDPHYRRKLVAAILLLILFLIALVGEAMQDRTLRRWAFAWLCVVAGGLAVIMTCVWLLVSPVLAHDHDRPDLDQWYHDLHSKNKTWCCEGDEATHLADPDWESKDGHYRVKLDDGNWHDVPDGAVIQEPNMDGRALVWTYRLNGWGGDQGYAIRCFLPGAGS